MLGMALVKLYRITLNEGLAKSILRVIERSEDQQKTNDKGPWAFSIYQEIPEIPVGM